MKEENPVVALRRKNLRRIMDEAKQNGLASSAAAFAEKYEVKGGASFLSQLVNGHGSFGDKVARRLEAELNLEQWFLDKDHQFVDRDSSDTTPKKAVFDEVRISPLKFRSTEDKKGTVRIPVHRNVKASCGDGVANFLEDITDFLDIDPNLLKLMGIKLKPERLRIIYSEEWSMWPTVAPDSPLFIDITPVDTSAMINGDVYVFLHNSVLRMKRVFVSYGDEKVVRLHSDNPDKNKFPDEIITKEQLNELSFVGRLELALVKP